MAINKEDLDVIHNNRLADVEQTFELGSKLYMYEWSIGSKGIGIITVLILITIVWITTLGLSIEYALIAVSISGLFGLVSIWRLRSKVINWQKKLLKDTNSDREKAYARHIDEVDQL